MLCHKFCNQAILGELSLPIFGKNGRFKDTLLEIANFSDQHTDQAFMIKIEDRLGKTGNSNELVELITSIIPAKYIYTKMDLLSDCETFPSYTKLKQQGKRFVIATNNQKAVINKLTSISINVPSNNKKTGNIIYRSVHELQTKGLPNLENGQSIEIGEDGSLIGHMRILSRMLKNFLGNDEGGGIIDQNLIDELVKKYDSEHLIIIGIDNIKNIEELPDNSLKITKLNALSYNATIVIPVLLLLSTSISKCLKKQNHDNEHITSDDSSNDDFSHHQFNNFIVDSTSDNILMTGQLLYTQYHLNAHLELDSYLYNLIDIHSKQHLTVKENELIKKIQEILTSTSDKILEATCTIEPSTSILPKEDDKIKVYLQ